MLHSVHCRSSNWIRWNFKIMRNYFTTYFPLSFYRDVKCPIMSKEYRTLLWSQWKEEQANPCLANPLNPSRLRYEKWLCAGSSWAKICQLIRLDALHARARTREKTGDVYLERQDKLSVASSKDSRIARKLLRESHEVPSRIQFSGDQSARYGGKLWKSANWNARIARQDECRHDEVEGRRVPLCWQDESWSWRTLCRRLNSEIHGIPRDPWLTRRTKFIRHDERARCRK